MNNKMAIILLKIIGLLAQVTCYVTTVANSDRAFSSILLPSRILRFHRCHPRQQRHGRDNYQGRMDGPLLRVGLYLIDNKGGYLIQCRWSGAGLVGVFQEYLPSIKIH
jgi:hypothetical protein